MKRISKSMKRLDLIATSINLLYVFIGFILLALLFSNLEMSPNIALPAPEIEHHILGFTLMTSQMNLFIGTLVAYLVVFTPLTFMGFKRVINKEEIELDVWHYRHQYLLSLFDFLTLNLVGAAVRFMLALDMSKTKVGYGFITSVKKTYTSVISALRSLGKWLVLTYKKIINIFLKEDKKYVIEKKYTEVQEDIEKLNRKDLIFKIVRMSATYVFLTFMALFIFIPFYWMFITALKDYHSLTNDMQPSFFLNPKDMQWINFKYIVVEKDFGKYIGNTVFVGVMTMIGTVIITILSAFAFSRLEWKGREFVFSILLMTMMIPGELYTITNYVTVSRLGWVKSSQSFLALIIPFVTSVFYIFFLRQSFKQIPDTLYRAARVDGCSDFKYLLRVMIPIASPTIITIIILSAMGAWDAYIWPRLVTSKEHWLISVALRSEGFTIGEGSDARPLTNLQVAASALVTVPLLIVFFSLKKYIIRGVGRSGTKG